MGHSGEYPLSADRHQSAWHSGPMEFLPETINGLPLHPLVVHAAVVLIPLSGALALLMVVLPRFSIRFGPLVVVLAWGAVGAALVAKETGEILSELVNKTRGCTPNRGCHAVLRAGASRSHPAAMALPTAAAAAGSSGCWSPW